MSLGPFGLLFLAMLVLAFGIEPTGQAPIQPPATAVPAAPTPPAVPTLSETEMLYLKVVSLTEQIAFGDCSRLPSTKTFQDTWADVTKRIEDKHPGYALDRARGVLVAKAAAPAK